MKKVPSSGVTSPQSFHNKAVVASDTVPEQSFNKKKAGSQGGELRQEGYRPSEKMNANG
jgi:hypothetical protein